MLRGATPGDASGAVREGGSAEELQGFARGKKASGGRNGRVTAGPTTPHQGMPQNDGNMFIRGREGTTEEPGTKKMK